MIGQRIKHKVHASMTHKKGSQWDVYLCRFFLPDRFRNDIGFQHCGIRRDLQGGHSGGVWQVALGWRRGGFTSSRSCGLFAATLRLRFGQFTHLGAHVHEADGATRKGLKAVPADRLFATTCVHRGTTTSARSRRDGSYGHCSGGGGSGSRGRNGCRSGFFYSSSHHATQAPATVDAWGEYLMAFNRNSLVELNGCKK